MTARPEPSRTNRELDFGTNPAGRALREMTRQNPGIRPFLTPQGVRGGAVAADLIKDFLLEHPQLIEELDAAHDFDDADQVSMLVLPHIFRDTSVVISRNPTGLSAFAPVLGCTNHAIEMLSRKEGIRERGEYTVVTSDNKLMHTVADMISRRPDDVLTFKPSQMQPEDYIALGASGALYDEVFRVNLKEFSKSRK